ncbi:MAG: acyloxyacyl hydrolase [Magnetovibrionaceae bacterium]
MRFPTTLPTLLRQGLFAAFLIAAVALQPGQARADDPAFLTIAGGWFDFNRQKDQGGEYRLEYRSDYKLWVVKPFAAIAGSETGNFFVGAGILADIYFGRRWVVTPSFAPHYYAGGNDDLDLGYELEFRSQLEVAYRFDNRARLGLAISHYSNASLGDSNPGTETLSLNLSWPMEALSFNSGN